MLKKGLLWGFSGPQDGKRFWGVWRGVMVFQLRRELLPKDGGAFRGGNKLFQ